MSKMINISLSNLYLDLQNPRYEGKPPMKYVY